MAVIKEINQDVFDETVASGTVLVDFWAPWCSYCRVMGAVLEQSAASLPAELCIAKINVDDNAELAAQYNITTLPTLIIFKDGKESSRYGNISKAELIKALS